MSAPTPLSLRVRAAAAVGGSVAALSRLSGRGGGSVVGGRVAMRVAPRALRELADGRQVAMVSGTNGKTTTTTMLRAALEVQGAVASNAAGSNMPAGLLAALMGDRRATTAVLEVDEAYLPGLLPTLQPTVVLLLNLSRDQLDRHHEVSRLASRWRQGLALHPPAVIVANADDPLVMWAASGSTDGSTDVLWVAGGMPWSQDAALCPRCGQALAFPDSGGPGGWCCTACELSRPDCAWSFDAAAARCTDGRVVPLDLSLPGRANRLGVDQIADRFGFGEIHAPVRERTQTEFARIRHSRTF